MMFLITGAPGNGKTLRAVWHIVNAKKENDELVKAGKAKPRNFYSDIEGLKLDYVLPADKDWRNYPDGSYIVYDEAHQLFPGTGRPGRADDPIINQMDEHRHRGFDIGFITQWPTKIHHEVRQLITLHEHLHRSMGLEAAGVLTWERVHLDPYDFHSKENAQDDVWYYPKDLYKSYTSSSLHTASHKFKMPAKVKNFLLSLPIIVGIIWVTYLGLDHFVFSKVDVPSVSLGPLGTLGSSGDAEPLAAASATGDSKSSPQLPASGEYIWQNAQPVKSIAGCVSSDKNCRCFNSDGDVMDLGIALCRKILLAPLPFNVFHEFEKSSDNRAGVPMGAPPSAMPSASMSDSDSGDGGPPGIRTEPSSVGPAADKVKGWIRSY